MTISPAALHLQRHETEQRNRALPVASAEQAEQSPEQRYKSHERVRFEADRARLSRIRSIQKRISLKQTLIADYRDYIQLVISEQTGRDDEIFITVLVWHIDAGDYSTALLMARYALEKGLSAPPGYNRQLPEVITEEFSEQVLKSDDPEAFNDWLQQLEPLIEPHDMSDQARAKFFKSLGLSLHGTEPQRALYYYQQARAYNPKITVKRQINQLNKQGVL